MCTNEKRDLVRKLLGFFCSLSLALFATGVGVTASARQALAGPIVGTEEGPVQGISLPGENEFLGIPYAAPPVGTLRWLPPKHHSPFKGKYQATQFGDVCTQPDSARTGTIGSEDCLTLNVYTPTPNYNQNQNNGLPVMVWIHGGSLETGGGAVYDPTRMVERGGVVAVTINYRLGLLGFFAHPAVDAERHLSGNYGLMDQQLALNWVQRNIAAFGGDPGRVTIFGESAGGDSVYANLASPKAAGLFSGAIAESGASFQFQDYYDDIIPLKQGETEATPFVPAGTTIAANLGCSSGSPSQIAACLRGLPASIIIERDPINAVWPFVDGTILTATPTAAFASGKFNRVPVITGGNHDEFRLFVVLDFDFTGNPILTMAEYDAATELFWGAGFATSEVEPIYPYADYPSGAVALGANTTDGFFACPERNSTLLLSRYVPTYAYEFNDENAPFFYQPYASFPLGAYHAAELQYLFDGDFFGLGVAPLSPAQEQLSAVMISYWTRFAKTRNPNSAGAPPWPRYSGGSLESLVAPTPTTETDASFDADHKCSSFWNTF